MEVEVYGAYKVVPESEYQFDHVEGAPPRIDVATQNAVATVGVDANRDSVGGGS